MSYSLKFRKEALKEWSKLDGSVRDRFKKKLEERTIVESTRASLKAIWPTK